MSGNRLLPKSGSKVRLDYRAINPVKTPKQIERHVKGIANHRRIEILLLGRNVTHTLSPYGHIFTKFITTFQHS